MLREDPALRLAVCGRRETAPAARGGASLAEGLCSQPTLSRLGQDLGMPGERERSGAVLMDAAGQRMGLRPGERHGEIALYLDSPPHEVFGHQPERAWNRHFRMRCHHSLMVRSE
jgi:hypothetical protein